MTTVLSGGEQVKIVFTHTHTPTHVVTEVGRFPLPRKHGIPKALTVCRVYGGTRELPLLRARGHAACAWEDTFVKEEGRQLALQRACEELSKEDAGRIKKAYFERPRGGRR